jgi:hypothetical protein
MGAISTLTNKEIVNVLSNLGEKEWNLLRIKQNVGTNILKRSFLNQAVFIKVYHMNS